MAWPQQILLIDSGKPPSRPLAALGYTASGFNAGAGSQLSTTITASIDEQKVMVVLIGTCVTKGTTAPSSITVSGGGLTWTTRVLKTVKNTINSTWYTLYEATAFAPTSIVSSTYTVTFNVAMVIGNTAIFYVQGGAQRDTNVALPASVNNNASIGYSTTAANTLVFSALNEAQPATAVPSGWSTLGKDNNNSPGLTIGYKVFSSVQTSVTATWTLNSGISTTEEILIDGIDQE